MWDLYFLGEIFSILNCSYSQHVVHKVHAPPLVYTLGLFASYSVKSGFFASATFAELQILFAIDFLKFFVVYFFTKSSAIVEQQPIVSVKMSFCRALYVCAQNVWVRFVFVSKGRLRRSNKSTGLNYSNGLFCKKICGGSSPSCRFYQFFELMFFSIVMSSNCSAIIRLSRAFSRSMKELEFEFF